MTARPSKRAARSSRASDRKTSSSPRDDNPRRSTSAKRNQSSLLALFMVLGITTAVVVYGIMSAKRNAPAKDEPTVVDDGADEAADPFAGMTYSYGAGAKRRSADAGPFGVGYASTAAEWQRAEELHDQAQALIDEITQLRAAGDFAWREKNDQAKQLMNDAYDLASGWRDQVVADKGADSAEVRSLERTLQKWNQTRMMLRKTGG